MFCHQYFLLRRVAWRKMSKLLGSFGPVHWQTWVWNWFAPSWRLSALWSSSESLLSLSSTFSTLTRMMSTTSPTCACACDSREFPCSGVSAILSLSDLSEMLCQLWQKPRGSESFCEHPLLTLYPIYHDYWSTDPKKKILVSVGMLVPTPNCETKIDTWSPFFRGQVTHYLPVPSQTSLISSQRRTEPSTGYLLDLALSHRLQVHWE